MLRVSCRQIARGLVIAAFAGLFAGGAHVGVHHLVDVQNQSFLGELNETALRYVEVAAASADNLLGDLARQIPADCASETLQRVRLRVYEHSLIKDVRVATHDGAVRCSAYSETLEFDRDWPARAAMLPASRPDLRLFRVEQFTSDALGILRDVSGTTALVAVVAVDPLQLDVLPAALRRYGRVSLELANGATVAESAPRRPAAGTTTVALRSASYPVTVAVSVDTAALGAWNSVPAAPIPCGAGLLGALFGLLATRLIGRPLDPAKALDAALRAGEFHPFYQPIFSLGDRRIIGCEVLMRWVLADGRVLPPSAFIPLAESTGRIEAMTWQVLARALGELGEVLAQDRGFKVAFNIVPRHFLSEGFQQTLERSVAGHGVAPQQIYLELTERDELGDLDRAQRVVRSLRGAGFKFALDDVGVGHSGLSHIQGLSPDTLKIDKFFVDALGIDAAARVVIDMLVRLAHELGMSVVAEGVETEAQVAALRACGVQQGQGYLVSPPVPVASFLPLVARSRADTARAAA